MSKARHRAPAGRRAELLGIMKVNKGLMPPDYDYTPKNRAQRRARTKAGRKRGDSQAPKRSGK